VTLRVLSHSSSASQSAVTVLRRLRAPIGIRQARLRDALRNTSANTVCATSFCTTTDLDTPGSNVERPLQFICQRRAFMVTKALARRSRAARDIARPRASDSFRSCPGDAGLSTPALYRRSPESVLRLQNARSAGVTCVRWQRKVRASRAPVASAPSLNRPQQLSLQSAPSHNRAHPFERVQMRPRPHSIYPASRTPASAEPTGHSATGGTPMHRLK
jgi:hypothetical protein